MSYKKWDVVVVNFPFADRGVIKSRPALICAGPLKVHKSEIYWALMITSTKLKGVDGDVDIENLKTSGLPIKSIVRTAKITCIDESVIKKQIGTIDKVTSNKVFKELKKILM